jgi:hypothetical protein
LKILKIFGQKSLEWKVVKFIKVHDSKMDDARWKYLVKHAHLIPRLRKINLEGNQMTRVRKKYLDVWNLLLRVNFDRKPLNQESLEVINKYSDKSKMFLE